MVVFFQVPGSHSAEMRVWRDDPKGVMQDTSKRSTAGGGSGEIRETRHGTRQMQAQGCFHDAMKIRLEITDLTSSSAASRHLQAHCRKSSEQRCVIAASNVGMGQRPREPWAPSMPLCWCSLAASTQGSWKHPGAYSGSSRTPCLRCMNCDFAIELVK